MLNEIQQRAIDRLVQQETKKQQNIEDITAQAISSITTDAKVENIEENWTTHFLIIVSLFLVMKCNHYGQASYLAKQIRQAPSPKELLILWTKKMPGYLLIFVSLYFI